MVPPHFRMVQRGEEAPVFQLGILEHVLHGLDEPGLHPVFLKQLEDLLCPQSRCPRGHLFVDLLFVCLACENRA